MGGAISTSNSTSITSSSCLEIPTCRSSGRRRTVRNSPIGSSLLQESQSQLQLCQLQHPKPRTDPKTRKSSNLPKISSSVARLENLRSCPPHLNYLSSSDHSWPNMSSRTQVKHSRQSAEVEAKRRARSRAYHRSARYSASGPL